MYADMIDTKDATMPTEEVPLPVHHRDHLEGQSAEEELPIPFLNCREEKGSSSLAFSQSGAKTDADNTISVPSAFGDHPMTSSAPTTTQKIERYSGRITSDSSSSSGKDAVQSKNAEDHHRPQKEEKMKDSMRLEKNVERKYS